MMLNAIGFTVCVAMAAINVVLYAMYAGPWNLGSAVFCGAMALYVAMLEARR